MLRLESILFLASAPVFGAALVLTTKSKAVEFSQIEARAIVEDCTTDLGRDLYGLGVRLGVSQDCKNELVRSQSNVARSISSGSQDGSPTLLFPMRSPVDLTQTRFSCSLSL